MSRYYTVFILCLTVFFLFADQNLMAPNLSSIADEFGFNDHERDEKLGGYIAFGFFIVGGPVALLVGYFTDSVNRCMLFAIVVTFGEAACFATYWIQTYEQLLVCRILTGISIGGSTPIIFSILGDLFPGNYRVYVSTLVGISMSSGIAGGQLLAGVVGPLYGWRLPFLLVSIPAILCANLVMLTVKEPGRGSQEKEVRLLRQRKFEQKKKSLESPETYIENSKDNEEENSNVLGMFYQQESPLNSSLCPPPLHVLEESRSSSASAALNAAEEVNEEVDDEAEEDDEEVEYSEKIEWRKLKVLFSTPSVWIIFAQGFPGCLPWGMVYVFLNDYFSADRGLSVAAATFALTLFGVGGLVGQLWGGWYGQRLYNRDPCYQCLLMGGSTLVAVAPMLYLINTRAAGNVLFYFMAVLAGATISINGPNVRTVLQNVCIPEVRGTAFAVFMLTDDIGKGLGPALVVLFIQAFGGDRQTAFTVVVLLWLFCGAMLLSLIFFVHADEQAVSNNVRASLLLRSEQRGGLSLLDFVSDENDTTERIVGEDEGEEAGYEPLRSPDGAMKRAREGNDDSSPRNKQGSANLITGITSTRNLLHTSHHQNSKFGTHNARLGCGVGANDDHSRRLLSNASSDGLETMESGQSLQCASDSAFQDL